MKYSKKERTFKRVIQSVFLILTCGICTFHFPVYAKDLTNTFCTPVPITVELHSATTGEISYEYLINPTGKKTDVHERPTEEDLLNGTSVAFPERPSRVVPKQSSGEAPRLTNEEVPKPAIMALQNANPQIIFNLYPRWFFKFAGSIRFGVYYTIHIYSALYLLWSLLKLGGRQDFLLSPAQKLLDTAVRPAVLFSTKVLPFTGSSGLAAQIFVASFAASTEFIRQNIFILYDMEFDYKVRERLQEADAQPTFSFANQDTKITGYEALGNDPTKIPRFKGKLIGQFKENLYNGKIVDNPNDKLFIDDTKFLPGGEFSLLDKEGQPILSSNISGLQDFDSLSWYVTQPALPHIRVFELEEYRAYLERIGRAIIKYPEIGGYGLDRDVELDQKFASEWGGYVFKQALAYWPNGMSQ